MTGQSKVPLRAVFLVGGGALLLFVAAVMLDPGIVGSAGDLLRRTASAVNANWVLLAAVAFPATMLLFLVVVRGAT
jgi:hypothetical protein